MYLYITSGEFSINIPDILLIDGFLPSVCSYQHPEGLVESAVWFKVAIIDSISIDCDHQRLSWIPLLVDLPTNNDASSDQFSEEASRCSYMDECILSSIDTLFASVSEWTSLFQSGQKTMDEFFGKIMQLLHIDILPSIQLTSRYVERIENMLVCQDYFIKRIDYEIIRKSEERNLKKQAHAKLRNQFMCDLLKPVGRKSQLPRLLICQLVSDFTKDLQLLKDRTSEGSMNKASSDLNLALAKVKELQTESRSFRRVFKGILTSVPMEPIHNIYMEMCIDLDRCSETVKTLTDKKLMMLSVKEAARSALQDLKSGEETFGIDFDCVSSVRCTDVLDKAKTTTLLSIAEQITTILANHQNSLSKIHHEFCRGLHQKCVAARREKALFDDVVKNSECVSCVSDCCASNGNMDVSLDDGSFNMSRDGESSCKNSSGGSSIFCPSKNNEQVQLRRAMVDNHSECLTIHSLPESTPTRPYYDDSPRSVSTYFSPLAEHFGKHVNKNRSSSSLSKSKKIDEPTFKSYLPDLISLREESLADSPMIVFDVSRIVHATEAIKNELMEHVRQMCFELQKVMNVSHSDISVYRQIWVNYESLLYNEMMQPLTDLYQLQYSNVTNALCESLPTLTAADLGLDEAMLVHLLQGACPSSPPSNSNYSPALGYLTAKEDGDTNEQSEIPKRVSLDVEPTEDSEDELCTLRRCFTTNQPQSGRLRTVRKSLEVKAFQRPTFLIYERKLNPMAAEVSTDDPCFNVEGAKTMRLKTRYVLMFEPVLKCIDAAISARTPTAKLRHLTQSLREASRLVAKFYADLFGRSATESGGDDLMDAVVILLCNIKPWKLVTLYCQVKLLADVMPEWDQRGHQCYTLMQFIGACQFIQDRLTCKRNRSEMAASWSNNTA